MIEDLSLDHHPVSDLFPKPITRDEWKSYRLSDEQVEFYGEHGYLAGIRILNDEQIDALRQELAALIDPGHPGDHLFSDGSWFVCQSNCTTATRSCDQCFSRWRGVCFRHTAARRCPTNPQRTQNKRTVLSVIV